MRVNERFIRDFTIVSVVGPSCSFSHSIFFSLSDEGHCLEANIVVEHLISLNSFQESLSKSSDSERGRTTQDGPDIKESWGA